MFEDYNALPEEKPGETANTRGLYNSVFHYDSAIKQRTDLWNIYIALQNVASKMQQGMLLKFFKTWWKDWDGNVILTKLFPHFNANDENVVRITILLYIMIFRKFCHLGGMYENKEVQKVIFVVIIFCESYTNLNGILTRTTGYMSDVLINSLRPMNIHNSDLGHYWFR